MTDIAQAATRETSVYRGMNQAELDTSYNNAAAVDNNLPWLDRWRELSAIVRAGNKVRLDIPYGPKQRTGFDYFPSGAANAPLFVFIHGGYWQRNAKELFSFVAKGPLAHGIDVAVVGYTLAPQARLTEIVAEIRQGVRFLRQNAGRFGFDPENINVGGWSAGGHLTAMVSSEPAVKGALAISGIFDLEPIALSYINAPLQLDSAEIETLSPLRILQPGAARQCIVVGGGELAELQRQSKEYAEMARQHGLPVTLRTLAGHHHFSILDELADPEGSLTGELLNLVAGRPV